VSSPGQPPVNQSTSGLSGGAKAGIAIGSVVVVAVLCAVVLLFLRRRRRHRADNSKETVTALGTDGKAEMDTQEVPRKEMGTGQEAHELGGEHGVTEIGANEPEQTFELPGEPLSNDGKRRDVISRKPLVQQPDGE